MAMLTQRELRDHPAILSEPRQHLDRSGHRRRRVLVQCPDCGACRMVDTRNIRRGRFTGRCRICNRRTRGPDANRWQGGRGLTSHGYVWIRTADGASEYEHRIVAEGMIGRPLEPWEHVHHRNGDKADNRPENLVVLNAEVHQIITELEAEVVRLRRRVKELEG